ncbi:Ribosomal RNA small subunit methyltransferase J [Buchnera aphidicola (Takecallis arundicolens)]|uniref:class I SAM-dependent methyltransferase n=1 Tax=Buchnera aphidicola TaxID=9 RepID=UPI0034646ED4
MTYKINIINHTNKKKLSFIQNTWNIKHDCKSKFSLIINKNRIELKNHSIICKNNIWVEFNYKKMKLYEYDKKIKMIQAIGIKKNIFPNILDATTGLGKDAFIFFSHGCHVTMVERNPIISILLYDGLKRSYKDNNIKNLIKQRMHLIYNTSFNINKFNIKQPDVIYLDPMFPKIKKKALSKKTIRTIQDIVGYDTDSDLLLSKCISFAIKRVVVKRPKQSYHLANIKPHHIIKTKKHRFDIYVK